MGPTAEPCLVCDLKGGLKGTNRASPHTDAFVGLEAERWGSSGWGGFVRAYERKGMSVCFGE